jgi:Toprim-like
MSERVFVHTECGKKKVYINEAKRVGWCHYCSMALGPNQVKEYLGDEPASNKPRVLSRLPPLVDAWSERDARDFLFSRLVFDRDLPVVHFDKDGRRLYFRVWSPSPELPSTYHTRGIDPGGKWIMRGGSTKGGYFFGWPSGGRVCIVEGIWDALRIGPGALALLGSSMSLTQETYLRNRFERVLVYMDPDDAGRKAQKEILSRLKKIGVKCSSVSNADKEPADYPPGHPAIVAVQEWLRKGEHAQDN